MGGIRWVRCAVLKLKFHFDCSSQVESYTLRTDGWESKWWQWKKWCVQVQFAEMKMIQEQSRWCPKLILVVWSRANEWGKARGEHLTRSFVPMASSDTTHVLCGCNILEWFQKAYRLSSLIHPFDVYTMHTRRPPTTQHHTHTHTYVHSQSHWTFQNRNKWVILTMILSTTAHPTWPICCCCWCWVEWGRFCYAMHGHKSMVIVNWWNARNAIH